MRLIIEFDGIVGAVLPAHYALHKRIAKDVGWSHVDEPTFRRLIRKEGPNAAVLRSAPTTKQAEYRRLFDAAFEDTESIDSFTIRPDFLKHFPSLAGAGSCCLTTMGTNLTARRDWLKRSQPKMTSMVFEAINEDPRKRPAELKFLADREPRAVVVATNDSLVRAAGSAELFSVGLPLGTCSAARLHQAGADIVFKDLDEFTDSLQAGAPRLVQAGLMPLPLQ